MKVFGDQKLAKKAFEDMKTALVQSVHAEVAEKIVAASKQNLIENQNQLLARLEAFDQKLQERVKSLVQEELKKE